MGDRAHATVAVRSSDYKKFMIATELLAETEFEVDDEVHIFFASDHQPDDERTPKAAKAGCEFILVHGAGNNYGAGMYVGHAGKMHYCDVNRNGEPIVRFDEVRLRPNADDIRTVKSLVQAKIAASRKMGRTNIDLGKF